MRGICPNCEKETDIKLISKIEEIKVRGETITVEVECYQCLECGEEFDDPRSTRDPLDEAYREYRRRRGMLQPEEIRQLRKQYGLTQSEMSNLLGWGGATLSRYENGALQDEAHEKILHLIKEPRVFLNLIEQNPDAIPKYRRGSLIGELKMFEKESNSIEKILEERFETDKPDETSGYMKLNLAKFFNAVLFFCEVGTLKTVLNKLLFYADFKHFKENTVSITGSIYIHHYHGPVPDHYEHYFATLRDYEALRIEEIEYGGDIIGEKFISEKKPDLSLFSETELKTIAEVKIYFRNFNATVIRNFSHNENGYRKTLNGEIISYKYARDLQI